MRQQEGSERNSHEKNGRLSAKRSKYSAGDAGQVKKSKIPNLEQESKQLERVGSVNDNWRQVQCDVMKIRKALNEEKRVCNIRKQELLEKETTLMNTLQNTLCEEQKTRTRVEEELNQARSSCNALEQLLQSKLAQLSEEICLREAREQELTELQEVLVEEQQERTTLEERLQTEMLSSQVRQQELQTKENAIREQQRLLEGERQQKTTLEERIRNLELQMQEERNRHLSTERELQSVVTAAQEELTEYERRQRDWIIQREEVVLNDKVLGKGAWGNVREGTFRSCQVAVKEIHELILSPHNRRLFEREMSIASCCRHPNLLQFIGATNDDGSPLFVTELLDTSLRHLLSQRALTPEEIVTLALDVTKGLNYLHLNKPRPIIHRDISSANVLLWRRDECWRAKLSDYGAANFMRHCMTVNPGAIIYSAPEALTSHQSPKVNMHSSFIDITKPNGRN